MEHICWDERPLGEILDESPDYEFVKQLEKASVQITKTIRVQKLRLRLEYYLLNQFTLRKFLFNAEIKEQPLPDSTLPIKLFQKLGVKGMVAYGYIHHADDLKVQVRELDDEDLDQLVAYIEVIMKPVDGIKKPGIDGINLWVSMQEGLDAHSDVFPSDLLTIKLEAKALNTAERNRRRRLRRGDGKRAHETSDDDEQSSRPGKKASVGIGQDRTSGDPDNLSGDLNSPSPLNPSSTTFSSAWSIPSSLNGADTSTLTHMPTQYDPTRSIVPAQHNTSYRSPYPRGAVESHPVTYRSINVNTDANHIRANEDAEVRNGQWASQNAYRSNIVGYISTTTMDTAQVPWSSSAN
ncbi:hypothetical protein DL98DRAFT_149649 [Cadophora sp. DSE1049]|nr:hypothetical protein DL98DRAFT_149649 [Cadophora sp. DSE1049]